MYYVFGDIYIHTYIYVCVRVCVCVCMHMCVCAKLLLSCLTLCNPMDCSPPDSSVHGIPRQEEWVVIPSSRGSSDPGIEPGSPALQADSLPFVPPEWLPIYILYIIIYNWI